MNQPQELRLFHNDKLSVLTQNKLATRFLRDVFKSDSHDIDVDLDLKGNFIFNKKNSSTNSNDLNVMYDLVNSKNSTPCLMIIRQPEKRIVTGLVQDILDNLKSAIDTPFLYFHLSNKFGESNIYQFIELFRRNYSNGEEWNDELSFNSFKNEFNTDKKNDLFTEIFNEIFYLYIKIWSELNIWERGHNNQYLFSFYEIFKRNNKIKVLDLDDNKSEFIDYLELLKFNTSFSKRSNNYFKKILEDFFENNLHMFRKLSTIVMERELYFYNFLKDKV